MFSLSMPTESFNRVQFFATLWTEAHQAPLSMGFFRQACWSGLPFLFPGNLHDPGINPHLLCLLHRQADSLSFEPLGKPIYSSVLPHLALKYFHYSGTRRIEHKCIGQLNRTHFSAG